MLIERESRRTVSATYGFQTVSAAWHITQTITILFSYHFTRVGSYGGATVSEAAKNASLVVSNGEPVKVRTCSRIKSVEMDVLIISNSSDEGGGIEFSDQMKSVKEKSI